jgi:hypothetical protein
MVLREMTLRALATVGAPMAIRRLHLFPLGMSEIIDGSAKDFCSSMSGLLSVTSRVSKRILFSRFAPQRTERLWVLLSAFLMPLTLARFVRFRPYTLVSHGTFLGIQLTASWICHVRMIPTKLMNLLLIFEASTAFRIVCRQRCSWHTRCFATVTQAQPEYPTRRRWFRHVTAKYQQTIKTSARQIFEWWHWLPLAEDKKCCRDLQRASVSDLRAAVAASRQLVSIG